MRARSGLLRPFSLSMLLLCGALGVLLFAAPSAASSDLYCGLENCYTVLGLDGEATPPPTTSAIKKAFYKLSLQFHPDKNPSSDAVEKYRAITTAYEVLSDAQSRADYDEALAHPERFLHNQYKYYKFRYKHAQKIDAWKVVLFTLIVASFAHWHYWMHRYRKLRTLIAASPLVAQRMRQKVKGDIIEQKIKAGVKNPSASKEEIEAALPLEDVSNYAELTSWEGRLPTWVDSLPVWLALAPWRLSVGVWWFARYFVWFGLMGREYGEQSEEAQYATASALGMSWNKWSKVVTQEQRTELTQRKMWIAKNMEAWRREMIQASKKKGR